MHMVMAVDVRRFTAKHINKAVELTIQLAGNLFKRQSVLPGQFPNPFPQLSTARQPGMGESGIPSVSTKCIPTPSSGVSRLTTPHAQPPHH
jgi:hypothetical protein